MGNVFVARKWDRDQPEVQTKLSFLNALNYPLQLLLFPEGKDFNARSKETSDKFADKNELPHYEYSLHPRTTGFVYMVNALRKGGLDAVYDVTIAFPDALASTEMDFVKGVIPREVHFHIKNYDAKNLPASDEGLAEWCKDRWREKEERLKDFYIHREFLERVSEKEEGGQANGVANSYHKPGEFYGQKRLLSFFTSFGICIGLNFLCIFLIWKSLLFFLVGITGMLYMAYISYFRGGLDYLVLSFAKETIN